MDVASALVRVAERLGPFRLEAVFVGPWALGALLDEIPEDFSARGPVEVLLDGDERALARLRAVVTELGFVEQAPVGALAGTGAARARGPRFLFEGLSVELVPLEPAEFSNPWYPDAYRAPLVVSAISGPVRVIDGPHFCGAGFAGDDAEREDVARLVVGRGALLDELARAPGDLRDFVARGASRWLASRSGALSATLRERLEEMARLGEPESEAGPRLHVKGQALEAWNPTHSRSIRRVAHDRATDYLTVEFASGSIYEYYGVPRRLFEEWQASPSVGAFHNDRIKWKFLYRRLV